MSRLKNPIIEFHDNHLYSVNHNIDAKILECKFYADDGGKKSITMRGISEFRCNEFGLQNVTLEFISTAWQKIPEKKLELHIEWLFKEDEWNDAILNKNVDFILRKIDVGELHCAILIPSYGAQFCAIFREIEISEFF